MTTAPRRSPAEKLENARDFAGQFLKSPGSVGAIAPSSTRLARKMLAKSGVEEADVVVELGPGTGSFTREILPRLKPGARFVAIEQNPAFAAEIAKQHPQIEIVAGSAADARDLLAQIGIGSVGLVVSGLPWASFPPDLQKEILGEVRALLGPRGKFVTFAYVGPSMLPRGRAFRRRLASRFPKVETSRIVWRNLPPAFVYRCE